MDQVQTLEWKCSWEVETWAELLNIDLVLVDRRWLDKMISLKIANPQPQNIHLYKMK